MKKIMFFVIVVLLLTGCSSAKYKENMEAGKKAINEGNYDQAVTALTVAMQEEPKDEEAKKLFAEATKIVEAKNHAKEQFDSANKAFVDGNYKDSIATLSILANQQPKDNETQKIVEEAKALLTQAQALEKELQPIQEGLDKGRQLVKEEKYDEAVVGLMKITDLKPQTEKGKKMQQEAQQLLDQAINESYEKNSPVISPKDAIRSNLKVLDLKAEKKNGTFDIGYKIKNDSQARVKSIRLKVTLLDVDNNPLTSTEGFVNDIPVGEYKDGGTYIENDDMSAASVNVEIIDFDIAQ
ncbi:hypothetical protein [Brevibacillus parabrevis]|jgi:hypothetical protein|uniref:hypothetical protein n=1 Tax=Brevibacillus parabrevis TaxID=54914 RepID=UPI002493310B|nr:hypothetical protein [Brevibacillus parabrevis]